MPNYVINEIKARRPVLQKLLNENGEFTFNTFINQPKELEYTHSSTRTKELIAMYFLQTHTLKEFEKLISKMHLTTFISNKSSKKELLEYFETRLDGEFFDVFRSAEDNSLVVVTGEDYYKLYQKYGYYEWYSWRLRFWGTKWNAFDVDVDFSGKTISFTTANSKPEPIFRRICELFPNENITFSSEYEENYLILEKNNHGFLETLGEYERNLPDDVEDIDYDDYPWTNIDTGRTLEQDETEFKTRQI